MVKIKCTLCTCSVRWDRTYVPLGPIIFRWEPLPQWTFKHSKWVHFDPLFSFLMHSFSVYIFLTMSSISFSYIKCQPQFRLPETTLASPILKITPRWKYLFYGRKEFASGITYLWAICWFQDLATSITGGKKITNF